MNFDRTIARRSTLPFMLLILFLALATAILNGCGDSDGSSGQNSAETGTGNGDDTGGGSGGDDNAAAQGWNLDTGSNEADLAENLAFVRIAIDLDTQAITALSPELSVGEPDGGITPVLLGGETVVSVSEDEFGLNITAELPADLHAEFVLGGTTSQSLTFYSNNPFQLTLDGVDIASLDGPALNIQSTQRAFIMLSEGSSNTLADSPVWSDRNLPGGGEMDLKGTVFSEGPLIFGGNGNLSVSAISEHAIASDAHVRLRAGTLTVTSEGRDGIRADEAFIMDDGALTIRTLLDAGKGIKVDGKESDTLALGFIVINDGSIDIESYDKAITASWEAEDGDTTTLADDPDPRVTINGGTFIISTFGTPFETASDSLSPEGIESKTTLTINGGDLRITTTDDALNAGTALVINGGSIYADSSNNDAVDSNGSIAITGGVLVAIGAGGFEGGIDNDRNPFTVSGGTFIGIGGRNSVPPSAANVTQNTLSLSNIGTGTLAIRDGSGNAVFAYEMPVAATAVLLSSSAIASGATYTVYLGGAVSGFADEFNGLYLGSGTHAGGTARTGAFTISSSISSPR